MGLFDIFKTQWSAGKMTPDDRKKLFWFLKRKTSYTAWKREADAFDAFSAIFKKQVIEEPRPKPKLSAFGQNWETSYPQILKAQVLYEKALARLLQGDRSVWLYNERGLFGDASNISSYWYSELVNNGARCDHFFDGKYVEEMTEAIKVFYIAARDTGYQQSMMADRPAPHWWGEGIDCLLKNELFPRYPEPGDIKRKLASLIRYPDPLPEVPVAEKEILIRTGENTPVFGIYEPQVKDGCMNYLLQDTPAPLLDWDNPRPVTWRLIWEDTRYVDGVIPPEEALYFPPEEKIVQLARPVSTPDLPSALTGDVCSKSGNWAVLEDVNGKKMFQKGDKLPQHNGRDVTWLWVNT